MSKEMEKEIKKLFEGIDKIVCPSVLSDVRKENLEAVFGEVDE